MWHTLSSKTLCLKENKSYEEKIVTKLFILIKDFTRNTLSAYIYTCLYKIHRLVLWQVPTSLVLVARPSKLSSNYPVASTWTRFDYWLNSFLVAYLPKLNDWIGNPPLLIHKFVLIHKPFLFINKNIQWCKYKSFFEINPLFK